MPRRSPWFASFFLLVLVSACVEPAAAPDAGERGFEDVLAPPDAWRADAWRPDGGPDAGPPAELEAAVDYWIAAGGLRGVAAIAADADTRVVVTRGMATDTLPVDEHTLFNVASLSKTFVCALALELVEEGLLDLDAPLEDVMPELPVRHPGHPGVPITARMLLSHTSGLADRFGDLARYTTESDPTVDLETFTREYASDPAHWEAEPGTSYDYCNACYGIMGHVIARASGRDFRALTAERLLTPLALDGAAWFLADVDDARLAVPYAWDGESYRGNPQRNYAFYPASSMMISIVALERWARGHLDGGVIDGVRFLTEASVAETQRAQFPAADPGQGLTWYEQDQGGRRFWGHSGASFGTAAQMRYRPEEGRLFVLVSNSDAYIRSRLGDRVGRDAIDAILARLEQELDTR